MIIVTCLVSPIFTKPLKTAAFPISLVSRKGPAPNKLPAIYALPFETAPALGILLPVTVKVYVRFGYNIINPLGGGIIVLAILVTPFFNPAG